jgi:uncharacterized protein YfaP (DUF2135 family)
MSRRTKWVSGIVSVLLLVVVVGCSVTTGTTKGGGQYIRFTILGKSFTFLFGDAGKIDVEPNRMKKRAASLQLFEEQPPETPPNGQMRLLSEDVSVTAAASAKEGIAAEADPPTGTATIRISMATGTSPDLCDSATLLAEYTLNVTNGVAAFAQEVYELSRQALDVIVTNDVTVCIDTTADFAGTITLTKFSLAFGGGENENKNDNESANGNDNSSANANGNDNGGPTQETGTATGQVVNALTGVPVAGAAVTITGTSLSATTDAQGNFSIADVPAGGRTVVAAATGYVESSATITVAADADTQTQIGLVPLGEGGDKVVIVLAWGTTPYDLDLHLSGPDGAGGRFHAYFSSKNPVPYAFLDLDDRDGSGPETLTIRPRDDGTFVAGDYHVWVHNYSGSPEFDASGARVTLTAGGTQLAQYDVGVATGSPADDIWEVVNLTVSDDGSVTGVSVVQTFTVGSSGSVF